MLEGVSSLPIFDLSLFSGLQSINSSSPISRSEIVIELELALVLGSLFRRGDKHSYISISPAGPPGLPPLRSPSIIVDRAR